MKRLGFYVFTCTMFVMMLSGFLQPEKVFASVTDQQISSLISDSGGAISGTDPKLGTRYIDMVNVVATKFKNDPDVSINQIQIYALSGIPGGTLTNEKGFIPFLQEIINTSAVRVSDPGRNYIDPYTPDGVTSAKLALVQAQQMLSGATTRNLLSGGVISQADANNQITNANQSAQSQRTNILQQTNTEDCNFLKGNLITCANSLITWLIKNTLMQIAGFLAWLSANLFNKAIVIAILNFKFWAPDALYLLWVTVKQIISLCVVFAVLFLLAMYIMGKEEAFGKYFAWLILFAIFVNFSYPISRVPIDISNIISLNIYSAAFGPEVLTGTGANTAGAIILSRLGLQGLALSATSLQNGPDMIGAINSIPGALLAVAFILYAAYVLFMATGILVIRTGVLVATIVASPLLFVDSVIPRLGDAAMKLRKMYFEQIIVAPVFMIMLVLTLKFLEAFQRAGGPMSVGNSVFAAANGDSVAVFFNIVMMIVMLHIMLKVTKEVSGSVGQMATNAMGKVGGFGMGLAAGGTGILARQTVGRFAAGAVEGKGTLGSWMRNNQDTFLGKRAFNLTNSLAGSTFDARNSGIISKGMSSAGMGMGAGGKANFGQEQKAKQAEKEARSNSLSSELLKKEASDRKLASYSLKTGEKKKDAFLNQDDAKMRSSMLGADYEEAMRENQARNEEATTTAANVDTRTPEERERDEIRDSLKAQDEIKKETETKNAFRKETEAQYAAEKNQESYNSADERTKFAMLGNAQIEAQKEDATRTKAKEEAEQTKTREGMNMQRTFREADEATQDRFKNEDWDNAKKEDQLRSEGSNSTEHNIQKDDFAAKMKALAEKRRAAQTKAQGEVDSWKKAA